MKNAPPPSQNATHPERGTPPDASPPIVEKTGQPPFVVPDRTEVTSEPRRTTSGYDPQYPDVSWISNRQMGGGHVPDDYEWTSNPYERREEGDIG